MKRNDSEFRHEVHCPPPGTQLRSNEAECTNQDADKINVDGDRSNKMDTKSLVPEIHDLSLVFYSRTAPDFVIEWLAKYTALSSSKVSFNGVLAPSGALSYRMLH